MAKNFSFDEGTRLRVIAKLVKDATPALAAIGAFLVAQSGRAFREQRFGNREWPARRIPNVPGIVQDLNRGSPPKARRFQGRPALVDTGNLRRSITFSVQAPRSVVVGTTLPYAGIHQTGGLTEPVILTPVGRDTLARVLRRDRNLTDDLGHLFSKPTVFRNVPARPFVGLQPGDSQEIEKILVDVIEGSLS